MATALLLTALLLLSSLTMFAAERSRLEDSEATAFRALFGTSDIVELKAIEANPAAHWEHRKRALLYGPNKVIPHSEFCKQFVKEAQQETLRILAQDGSSPWFKDFTKLDAIIEKHLSEDHPLFHNARALYYGYACDCTYKRMHRFSLLSTSHDFDTSFERWADEFSKDFSHEFNRRIQWQILPGNGNFPIFDGLVMRSENIYLCSIPQSYQYRHAFSTHENRYRGWSGLISHDPLTHARQQYILDKRLQDKGISAQDQFHLCCQPSSLIENNISLLAQQSQGNFYHFHELPAAENSYSKQTVDSMLFPTADRLLDEGFMQITPVFMGEEDTLAKRLKTAPPSTVCVSATDVHETLLSWRNIYCGDSYSIVRSHNFF